MNAGLGEKEKRFCFNVYTEVHKIKKENAMELIFKKLSKLLAAQIP